MKATRRILLAAMLLWLLAPDATARGGTDQSYERCVGKYHKFKAAHAQPAPLSTLVDLGTDTLRCLERYSLSDTTAWLTDRVSHDLRKMGRYQESFSLVSSFLEKYPGIANTLRMNRMERRMALLKGDVGDFEAYREHMATSREYFQQLPEKTKSLARRAYQKYNNTPGITSIILVTLSLFLFFVMIKIGPRIRMAMKEGGVSVGDVAKKMKVSKTTVHRWRADNPTINLKKLSPLSRLLKKPVAWFFLDAEMPELPSPARASLSPVAAIVGQATTMYYRIGRKRVYRCRFVPEPIAEFDLEMEIELEPEEADARISIDVPVSSPAQKDTDAD